MAYRFQQLLKRISDVSKSYQNHFQMLRKNPTAYIGLFTVKKNYYGTVSIKKNISSPEKAINSNMLKCSSELSQSDLENKLQKITKYLEEYAPQFFVRSMSYHIYDKDVIFENQITNKTTVGVFKYKMRIDLIKAWGNINFGYLRMDILHISYDPRDLVINVRWRICGIPGIRLIFQFWKYKISKWSEIFKQEELWYDGVSHLYLNKNGLIYKHLVTKITPESNNEVNFNSSNVLKAILAISLIPKEYLPDYA